MCTKHSTRESSIWWKCTWRSSHQCRGSLKTNLQKENPQVGQPHNHPPNQNQVQLAKVRLAMKRQATETRDKPSQTFARTVTQCEDEIKAMLPTASTCARTIRKQRPTPLVPQHLAELGDLPQDSTLTLGPNPEPSWSMTMAATDMTEGWNNKFHNLVGHHHPSIWRVIDWFQKEETTVRIVRQQDNVERQSKQGRQRYIRIQERLWNLCADRRDGRKTVEQTLRGIGWNMRLNKRTAN